MSDIKPLHEDPDSWTCFAVVVDNEVAQWMCYPITAEREIAIFNSEPKFIQTTVHNRPNLGDIWDGEKFTSPEGDY